MCLSIDIANAREKAKEETHNKEENIYAKKRSSGQKIGLNIRVM